MFVLFLDHQIPKLLQVIYYQKWVIMLMKSLLLYVVLELTSDHSNYSWHGAFDRCLQWAVVITRYIITVYYTTLNASLI